MNIRPPFFSFVLNDLRETVQSFFNKPELSQWSVGLWRTSLKAQWLLGYCIGAVLLCFSCVEKWLTSVFAFVAANWQPDKAHVAQGRLLLMS